ncbi:succinylglutamate desuccinylase [Aeromonas cavernicola]|uniref:Succinylglutamate desuccinylase n=1 Tax=Aeromonas cavernicola TaxID=1006623 RepID=A0A2H9U4P7_9GAMM|nr:succinylglutamate desuccinylase [Aeromonas cavernicola]PJG59006.1 succinylglutamate desuccinylase [Aeromonas cavernicola]
MIPHYDFLALTCRHEWLLEPFTYDLADGTRVQVWDTGVLCLEPPPERCGKKDIVLSCGVHGNETAPIEICNHLLTRLLSGELVARQRVLFLFGNPAAINLGVREVAENLNRLFSGAHSKGEGQCNRERTRAMALEQYVSRFFTDPARPRYHYDLHTAIRGSRYEKFAVYPFLHQRGHDQAQVQFLGACGVRTILLSNAPTTTFSYYSSHQHGAHAFTIELGQVRPFGENDMTRFVDISHTLQALITQDDILLAPWHADDFKLFAIDRVLHKKTSDFRFLFAQDADNFTEFPQGFLLAEDGELRYCVEKNHEAIVFPNANVAIGQRTLLLVTPTQLWR